MIDLGASIAILLTAANPAAVASNGPDADRADQKVVCRTVKLTGTRFAKRYCKTSSEWRVIEEKSVGALRELQARPQICVGKEGC